MPDWRRAVRERLDVKGIEAEREAEIVEELASYAEDAFREAIARGDTEDAAAHYAWQQLGDLRQLAEKYSDNGPSAQIRVAVQRLEDGERRLSRHSGMARLLADFLQDIRFAVRTLRLRPLFTSVVLIALALGIGSTTTVFSLADAALFQELPYRDAGRLVSIWTERQDARGEWQTASLYPTEHQALEENAETLESVALYFYASMTLRGEGRYPIDYMAGEGTAALAEIVGIQPQLGRWFLPEEVGPDASMVAVLGDAVWRSEFGADPDVIGRTITLDHDQYTVIGVMPPEFRFENGLFQGTRGLLSPRATGERPVWVPTGHSYGARGGPDWFYQRGGWSFEAIARLRPGISLETAQADVEAVLAGSDPPGQMRVRLAYREDLAVAGLPSQVLLLAIPSLLLLLIACGNVGTLLVGEGLNRQTEIATRAALGAGVRRIVRLLLAESLLLGMVGSAGGVAVAYGATKLLVTIAPPGSAASDLQVNAVVLTFACMTGAAAGFLFGIFPALTMGWWSKGNVTSRMRGRTLTRSRRATSLVVGFEVALTVMILVAGGLFTRTVWNLFAENNGYDPENLIVLRTANDHSPRPERPRINQQILDRLEAIPGVDAATGSWSVPLVMSIGSTELQTEGQSTGDGMPLPRVSYDIVLDNFHEVLGIPLLEGRYFTQTDGLDGRNAALISESTARQFWPSHSPVGERVRLGNDTAWSTIVGVVGDVKYRGPSEAASAPVYIPYVQSPHRKGMRFAFTVRTSVDPTDIVPQLAAAAREVEPNLLIKEARLLETEIVRSATDQRYRALMVVIFGAFAALLAAVGIFGVVARSLASRTRELAIRVALGAEKSSLKRLILSGSLFAAGSGALAGVIGAFWASRLLSGFLFGVRTWDPATYGAVLLLVVTVCIVASYLPARRVLRIQPVEVLKGE